MNQESFHAQTNAERRRFHRKPIKLRVDFKCLDRGQVSEPTSQLAEDLGAGGLAMRTESKLPLGQILMLILFLPPEDKRRSRIGLEDYTEEESLAVEILSRVAWSAPVSSGGFVTGVQFLDLDPNNRKWLKDFLVEFQLDQPDSSLYT